MLKKLTCMCFGLVVFYTLHAENEYHIDIVRKNDFLFVDLELKINNYGTTQNRFLFGSYILVEKIDINNMPARYYRNEDTLFIIESQFVTHIKMRYKIPIQEFTFSDAVILRRECL